MSFWKYKPIHCAKNLSIFVLSGLLLVAVACGPSAPATVTPSGTSQPAATTALGATAEDPSTPDTGSQAAVPTAQPTATPVPTATSAASRSLNFAVMGEPVHVNWTLGGTANTQSYQDNFNDTLTWRPQGSSEILPRLAISWEQVAPDEWVWKLREDVFYQNGEKWNAPAAVHNLTISYLEESNRNLATFLGYFNVEWRADDEYTLRQKCPGPCVISPLAHTFAEVWFPPQLHDSLTEGERARVSAGNGPYKLVEWNPGVSLELEAFENYWQGEVTHIPAATIVWREEELVRAAMVQAGEVDLALSIGMDNLSNVPKSAVGGTSEVFMIMLNQRGKTPALEDERVRKALRHAVDCEALVEAFYGGRAKCQGSIFNESTVGARPDITRQYEYDPALAQQLLEEADYASKYAATTDLGIVTRQGRVPHDVEAMEALANFWNQIGVKAHVEVVEGSVWSAKFRAFKDVSEAVDVLVLPTGNQIGDGIFSLRYLSCDSTSSSVCNPEAQALVDAARAADASTREQKLYDAFKAAYDHAWTMSLFELPMTYGLSKDLDFTPRDDTRVRLNEQAIWLR